MQEEIVLKVGGGLGVDAVGREAAEKHKGAGAGVAKDFSFGKPTCLEIASSQMNSSQ